MKKIIVVLLLLIAGVSYGQDTIKINFLNGSAFDPEEEIEFGEAYIIKIDNINRHLFKVGVKSESEEYNIKPPEIFKDIVLPSFLNLGLPEVSNNGEIKFNEPSDIPFGVLSVGSNRFVTKDTSKVLKQDIRSLYKLKIDAALTNINSLGNKIASLAILENDIKNIYNSCGDSYVTSKGKLRKEMNEFLGNKSNLVHGKAQTESLENFINDVLDELFNAKDSLDFLIPSQLFVIKKAILDNQTITSNWKEDKLTSDSANFQLRRESYRKAKYDNVLLKSYSDSLQGVVTKVGAAVAEIKKIRSDNKIQQLIDSYNLINEANYTYISDPIEVEADEIKFSVDIKSEKLLPCNIQNEIKMSETYKVKGGWKIDFSSGFFVNAGSKDFYGRELFYESADSSNIIRSKDGGFRMMLSLGALMHIYERRGKKASWAFSSGLSTTTDFSGLNFHLGGSYISGFKNRIILSAGLTLREAKILDNEFDYDEEYLKTALPEEPPTIKVFPRVGGFIALTYNFSKFKKE